LFSLLFSLFYQLHGKYLLLLYSKFWLALFSFFNFPTFFVMSFTTTSGKIFASADCLLAQATHDANFNLEKYFQSSNTQPSISGLCT
jgi:hypothetical protein